MRLASVAAAVTAALLTAGPAYAQERPTDALHVPAVTMGYDDCFGDCTAPSGLHAQYGGSPDDDTVWHGGSSSTFAVFEAPLGGVIVTGWGCETVGPGHAVCDARDYRGEGLLGLGVYTPASGRSYGTSYAFTAIDTYAGDDVIQIDGRLPFITYVTCGPGFDRVTADLSTTVFTAGDCEDIDGF